jgi:uncharacterized protein YegL
MAATRAGALGVYVLLDISASMHGPALEALKNGYELVRRAVPTAWPDRDPIHFSVMAYGSHPVEIARRASVHHAPLARLEVGGTSALGRALRQLDTWADIDNGHYTATYDASLRRLAFVFTDGPGTDDWADAAAALRRNWPDMPLLAFACGSQANLGPLAAAVTRGEHLAALDQDQFVDIVATAFDMGR